MDVKIAGHVVDVKDAGCKFRQCFSVGVDKGLYVPGRGYVKYHEKPRFVCQTRMLRGCPTAALCVFCRVALVENGACDCPIARKVNIYVQMVVKARGSKRKDACQRAAQGFRGAYAALAEKQRADAAAGAAQGVSTAQAEHRSDCAATP